MRKITTFLGVSDFGKESLPSRNLMAAKRCATGRRCDKLITEETYLKVSKGIVIKVGTVKTTYLRGKKKWESDDNKTECGISFKELISRINQIINNT